MLLSEKFLVDFFNSPPQEEVRKVRRRHSIQPNMPTAEERPGIFAHYKATGKLPDYSQQTR